MENGQQQILYFQSVRGGGLERERASICCPTLSIHIILHLQDNKGSQEVALRSFYSESSIRKGPALRNTPKTSFLLCLYSSVNQSYAHTTKLQERRTFHQTTYDRKKLTI